MQYLDKAIPLCMNFLLLGPLGYAKWFLLAILIILALIFYAFRVPDRQKKTRLLGVAALITILFLTVSLGPRLPLSPYNKKSEYLALQELIVQQYYDKHIRKAGQVLIELPVEGPVGQKMEKLKIHCLLYVHEGQRVPNGQQGFLLQRRTSFPSLWTQRAFLLKGGEIMLWPTQDRIRGPELAVIHSLFKKSYCSSTE